VPQALPTTPGPHRPARVRSRLAARRVLRHARWRLDRVRRSLADSGQVRERRSYLLREIKRRSSIGRYVLRDGPVAVVLRHHTDDTRDAQAT